ncbi:hypothetical protein SARC_04863 [Sphaeroforma arctica JP610]|uniref:RAVE complex protein Rav1 C-terminal domain-containing protein n=1 Tax=Sphaeroforma arctica JP610 TaxID=667725 RepID=A0A0L0G3S4_9EUKA|nr:hypothetical protein SARC_04863 [Sphaeroforma arctica JP610]KNC82863.1 hypothetical protein SARC_04863 [Sphaeroforma arctica JP610]|eukprot:XP_014156765.1 hypothetical protein SARC_04863 [Sphaeroforma arctica JP610]
MRLQQVITGACNGKPYATTTGRFRDTSFVVYCKAMDVVIMYGDTFNLHQVIGQPKDIDCPAECVAWDTTSSRIAVTYGNSVLVYEPKFCAELSGKHPYRWVNILRLKHETPVHVVSWGRSGRMLSTGSDSLRVFSRPEEDILALETARAFSSLLTKDGTKGSLHDDSEDDLEDDFWGEKAKARALKQQADKEEEQERPKEEKISDGTPDVKFRLKVIVDIPMARPVYHLRFSPDGKFLASAGMFDRLVKVWWRREGLLKATPQPSAHDDATGMSSLANEKLWWTFSYLPHPRAVTGLQWREPSPLSYRRFQNAAVLMTSCCDRVSRVWVGNCGWTSDVLRFHLAAVVQPKIIISQDQTQAVYASTSSDTDDGTVLQPQHDKDYNSQESYAAVNWLPGPLLCLSTRDSSFDLERELALDRSRAKKFSRDLLGHSKPTWKSAAKDAAALAAVAADNHHYTHTCRALQDYAFAFEDDGAFVVWKIEGVDSQPRCIPQVSLVARMVDALPAHQAKRIAYEVLAIFGADSYNKGGSSEDSQKDATSSAVQRTNLKEGGDPCTPTEIALIARGSDGSISRWKLLILNTNDQLSFIGLEFDTICSGHTVQISHIKSHPEKPILLSMGTEKYRDRSELIVWATRPVRVMEGNLKPLVRIALVKAKGIWDPALMSWFPHQPAFVAIIEGSLGVWCIRTNESAGQSVENKSTMADDALQDEEMGEASGSMTRVSHKSIDSGSRFARDVISLHVFGVADDEEKGEAERSGDKSIRYYLVGLLKDGRSALVWLLRLGEDMTVIESKVIGDKPYELGLPEGVSISYLTRPFTTRLQHTSDNTGTQSEGGQDSLLLVSGCTDGIMRMWHCLINRAGQGSDNDAGGEPLVTWLQLIATQPVDENRTGYLTAKAASPVRVATKWKNSNTIRVWECVSTGGYESRLESTLTFPDSEPVFSFDWMDAGDGGSPVLAVGAGVRMHLYTQFTSDVFQPSGVEFREMHSFRLDCVTPGEGEGTIQPMSFRWTQDGSFVVGFADRMMVFSKWLLNSEVERFVRSQVISPGLYFNPSQVPGSVFELANACERPLPQYHPRQLHQLIMTNKFRTAVDVVLFFGTELRRLKKKFEDDMERDIDDVSLDMITGSGDSLQKRAKLVVECAPFLPIAKWGRMDSATSDDIAQTGLEREDDYEELFTMDLGDDDDAPYALGQGKKGKQRKITMPEIINLLREMDLPLITEREQVEVIAIVETIKTAIDITGGLDMCGFRAFCSIKLWSYMRSTDPKLEKSHVTATDAFWALHSESQETILELALSHGLIKLNWQDLRAIRFGLFIKSPNTLKNYMETLARNQFAESRDPLDVALWYIALKKQSLLANLFKSISNQRMYAFFSNDFAEDRWSTAAEKNAYVLLGQQRFVHAAAFFLLSGNIRDAASVCVKHLHDMQMAVVTVRLYEGDNGETMRWLFTEHFLPRYESEKNIAMQSIGHWLLKDYPEALRCLFNEPWHRTVDTPNKDSSRSPSPYNDVDDTKSSAGESISHMRAMQAFGSTVRNNQDLAHKTAAASGMVNLTIKASLGRYDEWYNPIITNCALYLRGHTLLQNVTLNREKVIRRVAEAMYSELHTGCMMVAIETLSVLRDGAEDLCLAPAGRELKVMDEETLAKQAATSISTVKKVVAPNAFEFDMGAFGGFDDFAEEEEEEMEEVEEIIAEEKSDDVHDVTQNIVCDILGISVAHQIGLRLLIRSMEQMRSTASWTIVSPYVRAEAQMLKDSYGVVGHGADSADKAGAEALLDALSFYYRMHDDLTIEIKMLGVLGYYNQILFQLQDQSRNLVLGIPHATYMRRPISREAGATKHKFNESDAPSITVSEVDVLSKKNVNQIDMTAAATLLADTDDVPSAYLLHVFEKTSYTISDSVFQLLSNSALLPKHEQMSERLLSLRLLGESFLVVYAGLFVSSWWSRGLDLMQDLLVNVPSQGLFREVFENKGNPKKKRFKKNRSHNPAEAANSGLSHSGLKLAQVPMDPDKKPTFDLRPVLMTKYFLRQIDFNDFSDAGYGSDDDSSDDTMSVASGDSNISAKLLDAVLNEDKNKLNPDKVRERKERDAYVYAVLRLACVHLVTVSMQRFIVDMELGDMAGLYETSPLLYSLLVVFEAWGDQVQDYTMRLPAPKNILMLDDYNRNTEPEFPQSAHTPRENFLNIPTSFGGGSSGDSTNVSRSTSAANSRSASPAGGAGWESEKETEKNPFTKKRPIRKTSSQHKLTALLDHKNNPFRKHNPVLRKLWYYVIRQESVRPILIRLLFHEEFEPEVRDPELGEELFRDTDSVRSFCLNGLDSTQFAVCTGKGSHWRTPQKTSSNQRIPLVAALRRRSMAAANKNLKREQKQQERQIRRERNTAREAQNMIKRAHRAAQNSAMANASSSDDIRGFANDVAIKIGSSSDIGDSKGLLPGSVDSFADSDDENESASPMTRSARRSPQGHPNSTLSRHTHKNTLKMHREESAESTASGGFVSLALEQVPHSATPSLALQRKKDTTQINVLEAHPKMPYYLAGSIDGRVQMYLFSQEGAQYEFQGIGKAAITSIRFDMFGNKFGACDQKGKFGMWRFGAEAQYHAPLRTVQAHTKFATDFTFLNSTSFVATGGSSVNSRNVCLWDFLVPPQSSLVKGFQCHTTGHSTSLAYASGRQALLSGGKRGDLTLFDIRQRRILHRFNAHDGPITSIAVDKSEQTIFTGSADGTVRIWDMDTHEQMNVMNAHKRERSFLSMGSDLGVSEVRYHDDFLYTCGSDGSVRRWG